MCTRYVLLEKHLHAVLARLGIAAPENFASRYNIAPGSRLPAVRAKPKAAAHEAAALRWGLVPSWAKTDDGPALVNARAETLTAKPSFRDAFQARRCVIPASGFYEWEAIGRARKPRLFRWRDEQPFGLAGLWESWRSPDGEMLETCAVITVEPNELMRPIHHRMPVMLTAEQFEPWLDPSVTALEKLAPLLRSPPADAMTAVAVSSHVSNIRNEGPECIAPTGPDADAGGGPQLALGFD